MLLQMNRCILNPSLLRWHPAVSVDPGGFSPTVSVLTPLTRNHSTGSSRTSNRLTVSVDSNQVRLRPVTTTVSVPTRNYSSGSSRAGTRISESTVFLQTGRKICELPIVVKKVNDIFELYRRIGFRPPVSHSELQPTEEEDFVLTFPADLNQEEIEVIDGFNRCFNSASIYRLLETIPRAEVTPLVAAHALRKIIDLENTMELRNPGSMRETIAGTKRHQNTFLRSAFMTMLLEIICNSRHPKVILDGLSTVMRDHFPADLARYKDRLLEELLVCVSEGIFNLEEVCKAIQILGMFYEDKKKCLELADKLWFGIVDQSSQITDPESIVAVFSTLPYLNKSRHIIIKILEEKSVDMWQRYSPGDIVEILRVLINIKYCTLGPAFLKMISTWFAYNINKVKENEMLALVYSFNQLNYMDDTIIATMEKIIKHKGCQINDIDLMCVIAESCYQFRIRSPILLEGISEYILHTKDKLNVPQILCLGGVFGHLDWLPANGFKFWQTMEHLLELNFVKFRPIDVIQLLVSFLYIERFPLNFTNKLFNPYFLDRLHGQDSGDVETSRQELKLYDAGMKMECRGYGGPYLPRETRYRSVQLDSRIRRISGKLIDPLGIIVGDISRLGTQVVLASLPLHPLYIVDLMIYPSRAATLLRFGTRTDNSDLVAVLIHLPEHYDRSQSHLLGDQVMRRRHLKMMGFRVMSLNYGKLSRMLMHPNRVKEYLERQYKTALKD